MSGTLRAVRGIALLLICILAGYYVGTAFWKSPPIAPDNPSPAGSALAETLPEFALPGLDGDLRSISEWSGRSMLINFWATWCAPCRREMPLLQTVHDERSDTPFSVIGIAVDRMPDVQAYIGETGVTYPILVGQQDAMDAAELFGPAFVGLPFTIFVGRNGQVLGLESGEIHLDELQRILAVMDDFDAGRISATQARAALAAD